jgi:RNA-directed DNA polymerase
LIYFVFRVDESNNYTTFQIKKRKGGNREISAPISSIKILPRKLNQVLQTIYSVKPSVHGFVRERSVISNAKAHTGNKYILNIDLSDFFPSIHFGRILGLFKSAPFNFNDKVAIALARLCCYKRSLPQGAPTSPILSNMICAKMDKQLDELARIHGCKYTRYADDITFSSEDDFFPKSIVFYSDSDKLELGSKIKEIITLNNVFDINPDKIKLRTQFERQVVTGITVNEFTNLPRSYVRQIRAMLHAWEKYGLENAQSEFLAQYDKKHRLDLKASPSFSKVVKGKIDYLGAVRGKDDPIYLSFRSKLRELAPTLLTTPETPLELMIRMSRLTQVRPFLRAVERTINPSEKVRQFLESVGLGAKYQGAWDAFAGDNPDGLSQSAHSMREILRLVLVKLAPDQLVKSAPWYTPYSSTVDITRKMRVRYILAGNSTNVSDSKVRQIDGMARFADDSYNALCSNAHSENPPRMDQTKVCLDACELAILAILSNKT